MSANDTQIGGGHYKKGGEEHWDRAWRLQYDPFQYIITKWVERWREKGGLEDLKKAQHAIDKYIEVNTPYCTCSGLEDGMHSKDCNTRMIDPKLPHERLIEEHLKNIQCDICCAYNGMHFDNCPHRHSGAGAGYVNQD